jgi:hypothetical protein
MHYHNLPDLKCHHVSNLAGIDWPAVDLACPATVAGRYIARHYNVDPSIADVVAGLAGLGLNEGAQ